MTVQQTSLLAYHSNVKPSLNYKQKIVLAALEEIYPATNKGIAQHLDWPINSITPRVLELRNKRMVNEAYKGKDSSGRSSIFWKPYKAELIWDNE